MAEPPSGPWDELRDADLNPRPAAAEILSVVDALGVEELHSRQAAAAADILTMEGRWQSKLQSREMGLNRNWAGQS